MKDENISGTMHILAVPDLDTTVQYYESVLGFTAHDVGDPGWKILQRGNMRIMAGHCPDAIAPAETGDHSYFAYVHV
ncbi:MAG: VOC family protein, partial [Leptospiraceae bacterium]|nr:VOC family protein [Leptospiraceae bacterium]